MFSTALAQHVLTAGIALALAYAVLVLAQRHNRAAHRWLALFLLCMACMGVSESIGMGARADAALLRWQGFVAWSVVALAPALFMYVRHLLSAPPLARWQVALHFLPMLLVGGPTLVIALTHVDPEFWRTGAQLREAQGLGMPGVLSALLALQWAAYGVTAWLLLQNYRLRLLAQYSNIDQRRMGWLGTLIACLPALLLLWLLARLGGPVVALWIDTLYVPLGVAVLATLALRQPAVLLEPIDPHPPAPTLPSRPPPRPPPSRPPTSPPAGPQQTPPQRFASAQALPVAVHPPDAPAPPPATESAGAALAPAEHSHDPLDRPDATGASSLAAQASEDPAPVAAAEVDTEVDTEGHVDLDTTQRAEDEARWASLQARLDELLATERPYLDNDLSLAALAQMLQTSTHHLSYVLNQRLGQSFYDLINERRVREVQRCLRDPAYASQSILEIALDSGFSSKATFNAAFRKHAGVTPSAYRQQAAAGLML